MLVCRKPYTVEGMSSLRVAPGSRVSLRSRKGARCTRPGHEMVRKSEISCPGRASASERRSGTQGPQGDSRALPVTALHRLDQHGAALAAADAFGSDALLDAEPLHRVHEVEHDAVAARAHGMAEAYCAAVHIQLVARNPAGGAGEPQHLAAEGVVLPGGEAAEHLRRERLVELPQPDVAE